MNKLTTEEKQVQIDLIESLALISLLTGLDKKSEKSGDIVTTVSRKLQLPLSNLNRAGSYS